MEFIDFKTGRFYFGDCLEIMPTLAAGIVDMVLCDLPYGTTQNKWDTIMPFDPLWANYWRVLKANRPAVLTAQCPFDKSLGSSQIRYLKYEWIWYKNNHSGFLNAHKQPMKEHENILVFYRNQCTYNAQGLKLYGKITKRSRYGSANYRKFAPENYQTQTGWPKSILRFDYDVDKKHPTQKPVALFEYLIRTYTNPGDLVLDNTAGSGTTAIAAINSGRRWICIEKDPDYFNAACMRVAVAEAAI